MVTKFGGVPGVEQQVYSKAWDDLVAEVAKNVGQDPYGPVAQGYAKRWMNLVNQYFSDSDLGEAIWNAYKSGNVPENEADRAGYPYIPQHVALWIDGAVKFMFKNDMMERFEKSWLGNVLSSEQLKKLMAAFGRVPEVDRRVYSQKWDALIAQVRLHLHEDPCGRVGQKYLKQWHALEYMYVLDQDIQDAIWDAYKRGVVPKNAEERLGYPDISLEMIVWLEKAAHITCTCKKNKK